jgi:hypothetical protein
LYWYDESGQKLLTPEERIQRAERLRLETEQRVLTEQQLRLAAEQKAQILAQKLRELNIDPDTLT